jgi:hypothetical protein
MQGLLPFVNIFEVTHWINPWSKESFLLFSREGAGIVRVFGKLCY